MKKIKVLMASAALVLGTLSAFAFADDPLCATAPIGYTQPIDNPSFQIPGTYLDDYGCNPNAQATCRYVKKADGTFVQCSGNRVQL
ncbi:hypothetical protein [Chitinophaga sp. 212800010-3]|uniref:hypothetical protein n=1 Tax=unclassified Chitinophaga TaxID=2619133 RepID=UPI002DE2FD3E|nr:hypothetical protein [Chitinophaga sp. 212800010-3]